jgi:hypothetical protein
MKSRIPTCQKAPSIIAGYPMWRIRRQIPRSGAKRAPPFWRRRRPSAQRYQKTAV